MTVKDYIAQEEKIRNIASQDISMFEKKLLLEMFLKKENKQQNTY